MASVAQPRRCGDEPLSSLHSRDMDQQGACSYQDYKGQAGISASPFLLKRSLSGRREVRSESPSRLNLRCFGVISAFSSTLETEHPFGAGYPNSFFQACSRSASIALATDDLSTRSVIIRTKTARHSHYCTLTSKPTPARDLFSESCQTQLLLIIPRASIRLSSVIGNLPHSALRRCQTAFATAPALTYTYSSSPHALDAGEHSRAGRCFPRPEKSPDRGQSRRSPACGTN